MRRVAVAIALLVAACSGGDGRGSASPSSDQPGASPSRAIPPTAAQSASPTIGPALRQVDDTYIYGGIDVEHPAGTYAAPDFVFPFTAEINRDLGVRDSYQEDVFVFINQDKNAPLHSDEEFNVMFLRQVMDPDDQRSLGRFIGDPFEWFSTHPRLTLVKGSTVKVTVDDSPARQADLLPSRPVVCGTHFSNLRCVLVGYGPSGDDPFVLFAGSRMRVVVVDHAERQIVFAYQHADNADWAGSVSVFDHWVGSVDFK